VVVGPADVAGVADDANIEVDVDGEVTVEVGVKGVIKFGGRSITGDEGGVEGGPTFNVDTIVAENSGSGTTADVDAGTEGVGIGSGGSRLDGRAGVGVISPFRLPEAPPERGVDVLLLVERESRLSVIDLLPPPSTLRAAVVVLLLVLCIVEPTAAEVIEEAVGGRDLDAVGVLLSSFWRSLSLRSRSLGARCSGPDMDNRDESGKRWVGVRSYGEKKSG